MDYGFLVIAVIAVTGFVTTFISHDSDNDMDWSSKPGAQPEPVLAAGAENNDLITQMFVWMEQEDQTEPPGHGNVISMQAQTGTGLTEPGSWPDIATLQNTPCVSGDDDPAQSGIVLALQDATGELQEVWENNDTLPDSDGQPLPDYAAVVHVTDFIPGRDELVIDPESGLPSDAFNYVGHEMVPAKDGTHTDIVLRYHPSAATSGADPQSDEVQSYIRVHNVKNLSSTDIVIETEVSAQLLIA